MKYLAKTYYNKGFTYPQNLSDFGLPIHINNLPDKFLGFEEWNFTEIYLNKKIAYLPAFSKNRKGIFEVMKLFYHLPNGGGAVHYATIHNVSQLKNNDVIEIRNYLNEQNIIHYLENNQNFLQAYGQPHFTQAISIYSNRLIKYDNIIAQGIQPRFVVNVVYEKIEILNNPVIKENWKKYTRARNLYHE